MILILSTIIKIIGIIGLIALIGMVGMFIGFSIAEDISFSDWKDIIFGDKLPSYED